MTNTNGISHSTAASSPAATQPTSEIPEHIFQRLLTAATSAPFWSIGILLSNGDVLLDSAKAEDILFRLGQADTCAVGLVGIRFESPLIEFWAQKFDDAAVFKQWREQAQTIASWPLCKKHDSVN